MERGFYHGAALRSAWYLIANAKMLVDSCSFLAGGAAAHPYASRAGEADRLELMVRVHNETKNVTIADRAGIADDSKTRRTGLLKRNGLEPGEGLWIVPCEAVHTFGMKFPIDVLYLNKKKKVIKVRENMVRSRMSFCLIAHSVLELPAGTCAATGTARGDQLTFEKV